MQSGILERGAIRHGGFGQRVSGANGMGMELWWGRPAAVIGLLAMLVLSLGAFLAWIKHVQFGDARGFVVAVMPAATINMVAVLAILTVATNGFHEPADAVWALVAPFAVYSVASFGLCVALLGAGAAHGLDDMRIDPLTTIGTLTAFYGFLLVLYPLASGFYMLVCSPPF